jgi:hypothetical protein
MMLRLYNDRALCLLLFLTTLAVFLANFPQVLLHPNALISGMSEDALKNSYTFLYHVKHDRELIHFSGMNYPYGEHVVYTDCQPLLTFIFRLLPFTHDHLLGIMYLLAFASFMIAPIFIYRIFRELDTDRLIAFFVSLGSVLLSPQYFKICLGHYALAWAFVVPLEILLLLRWFKYRKNLTLVWIVVLNLALYLHHPYLGLMISVFCFFSSIIQAVAEPVRKEKIRLALVAFAGGLAPVAAFRAFLALTDTHGERVAVPYGAENWNMNLGGLLVPVFGPFRNFLESIFKTTPTNFEALSYPGIVALLVVSIFIITLPFTFRRLTVDRNLVGLLVSSVLLLCLSFGIHTWLMNATGVRLNSLSQFRAAARFSWFFYHLLPVFIVVSLAPVLASQPAKTTGRVIAMLFFVVNLWEGYYYFRVDEQDHWRARNYFNPELLTSEEKAHIEAIKSQSVQAIIPLRLFHGGSEMYERPGIYTSMPAALFYSYHTGVPLISSFLSRSSLRESEDVINSLNTYMRFRPAMARYTRRPVMVLRDNSELLPDELRLSEGVNYTIQHDSLSIGFIPVNALLIPIRSTRRKVINSTAAYSDSTTIYVPAGSEKAYHGANMTDYEKFFVLDSNKLVPGNYVVSLHYHFNDRSYETLGANLIITEGGKGEYNWRYNLSFRGPSGIYDGFAVWEQRFTVKQGHAYEFIIKGFYDRTYRISKFMIRSEGETVISTVARQDNLINNFPR